MKIRILFHLLTLLLCLTFTACQKPIPQEVPKQEQAAVLPKQQPSVPDVSSVPDTPANPKLTKEEAAQIVLSHAKLTSKEVSRLYVEYDYDDGMPKYEVQFFYDKFEYDYEIDAVTGVILSFEKDRD